MLAPTLLLLATVALPGYDRVLLPMHNGDAQGANGSVWKVDEVIFNQSDQSASFYPEFGLCSFFNAAVGEVQAGKRLLPCAIDPPVPCHICPAPRARGAIFYIPSNQRNLFIAYDRVYESRVDSDNHGAVIPAVHESNFRRGVTKFPLIPIASNFRSTLRIYNLATATTHMTVQISASDGTLLSETDVQLPAAAEVPLGAPYEVPLTAGFAQIAVEPLVGSASAGPVTIVVKSNEDVEYWAFVSVTSNTAQRVTVFTPSP